MLDDTIRPDFAQKNIDGLKGHQFKGNTVDPQLKNTEILAPASALRKIIMGFPSRPNKKFFLTCGLSQPAASNFLFFFLLKLLFPASLF